MTLNDTINLIYTRPGRVFEALRDRPRFFAAALVVVATSSVFVYVLMWAYDYENLMRVALQNDPTLDPQMREEVARRSADVDFESLLVREVIGKLLGFGFWFVFGAALYFVVARLLGGAISYAQALSVWTYSSLPPLVISSLLNVALVLLVRPDIATAARAFRLGGLAQVYFSLLVAGRDAHPAVTAVVVTVGPFALYGLFLAALGLHKVAGLSHVRAWCVVLPPFVVRILLALVMAPYYS